MTTQKRTYMDARDATPAIHITGRPKNMVSVDDTFVYKNAKYFCDVINETDLESKQIAMENRLRRQAFNKEALMSDELKQLKRQEFIDRKRRQQLRSECEELRELAEQLRLASITKELEEHMVETKRNRELAKNAKAVGLQRAEATRQQNLAMQEQEELRKKEQQEELRKTLAKQIEEKRQQRQLRYVETLTEREMRMAMQQQIEEEDRAEQLELNRLKLKKRDDMITFIKEQREYKELQRAKSDENLSKALEKQSEIAEQKRQREEAKLETQRKQEEIKMRVGHQVFEIEERLRQRYSLLFDLLIAEYKAKDDERYRQQLKQEQFNRQRARQELELYRAEVNERNIEKARKKHEQTVERNLMCPDEGPDGINKKDIQERQRRKEHGVLLLSMIEDNNRKRAEAAAENMLFFDSKAKAEAERQERIQEERLQMLGSVPASVLQYLPKQVLTDSDRKYFNIQRKEKTLK
ncbi:meiosis-specific nuclear structural protein 1 [Drosophila virilis]|uniref:Meiosis-specific nuclear structural protein 1 n=1 Tax=Drosophila virilis TaxID=7244 RepID=B4LYY5_DROVI|nr:meiosis-specific nuclear structural protein 1 [Drosophila virilis]EDW68088.2 uncharacterized protein Dvir_GJ24529 [Drosophila virilis]